MSENGTYAGKVAYVTGAASGIGRATALAFAREGADVAIVDIDNEGLQVAASALEEIGRRALTLTTDVSDADAVKDAIDETVKTLGRLDVAFNNAGIFDPIGITHGLDVETWNKVIATNLSGIFYNMKYQIEVMLAQGGGSIINTGSVASVVGFQGIPAYTASKHGIVGLTKVAALDYATQGIRVNAVLPGVIDTPMMDVFSGGTPEGRARMEGMEPVKRMGTADEIAAVALFLGSDAASFVTGHALAADGGFTIQ